MVEQRYSLLLIFMVSACSQAAINTKVSINNQLSNCIKIDSSEVIDISGIPILSVSHQILNSTSQCGCKTAISQYSSQLVMDGYNSLLLTAKFKLSNMPLMLPLATSKEIIGDYSVLVNFSCALPD